MEGITPDLKLRGETVAPLGITSCMPWVRQAPGVGLFSSSSFDTHSFLKWGNPKLGNLCQVH